VLILPHPSGACKRTDGFADFQNSTLRYAQFGHHFLRNLHGIILHQVKVKLDILRLPVKGQRDDQLENIIRVRPQIDRLVVEHNGCHKVLQVGVVFRRILARFHLRQFHVFPTNGGGCTPGAVLLIDDRLCRLRLRCVTCRMCGVGGIRVAASISISFTGAAFAFVGSIAALVTIIISVGFVVVRCCRGW